MGCHCWRLCAWWMPLGCLAYFLCLVGMCEQGNGKVGTSALKMTENTEYTHETLIEFDDATQEKKIPDVCCIHVV